MKKLNKVLDDRIYEERSEIEIQPKFGKYQFEMHILYGNLGLRGYALIFFFNLLQKILLHLQKIFSFYFYITKNFNLINFFCLYNFAKLMIQLLYPSGLRRISWSFF